MSKTLQWGPLDPMGPEHIQFIMCAYMKKLSLGLLQGYVEGGGYPGYFIFVKRKLSGRSFGSTWSVDKLQFFMLKPGVIFSLVARGE